MAVAAETAGVESLRAGEQADRLAAFGEDVIAHVR